MRYFNHAIETAMTVLGVKSEDDFVKELERVYHKQPSRDAAILLKTTPKTLMSWVRRFGIQEKNGQKVFKKKFWGEYGEQEVKRERDGAGA